MIATDENTIFGTRAFQQSVSTNTVAIIKRLW
jgi:hypothetical protein